MHSINGVLDSEFDALRAPQSHVLKKITVFCIDYLSAFQNREMLSPSYRHQNTNSQDRFIPKYKKNKL